MTVRWISRRIVTDAFGGVVILVSLMFLAGSPDARVAGPSVWISPSILDAEHRLPTVAAGSNDPSQQIPGVPAIRANANTPIGTPAFTQNDVRDYFKNHPNMGDMYVDPGSGHPVITLIEFGTVDELRARGGPVPQGEPGDHILCRVTLRGTFKASGPPPGDRVFTYHSTMLVFDRRTGNLLESGG